MKFFDDHQTIYGYARKRGLIGTAHRDVAAWLQKAMPAFDQPGFDPRALHECLWLMDHRPYYSVFPSVADALARVTLDVDCSLVTMPLPRLLFRFAEQQPLAVECYHLRTLLVAEVKKANERSLGLWVRHQRDAKVFLTSAIFELPHGATVESMLTSGHFDDPELESRRGEFRAIMEPCLRIVVAVCLMQNDPDLITPDVLDADAAEFEETGNQSCVDRAHRRGKLGWLVGSHLEVAPHYRRSHFGVRWTGPGHSVARVVPVSGCIVKRKKLAEVPTGYLDNENRQIS